MNFKYLLLGVLFSAVPFFSGCFDDPFFSSPEPQFSVGLDEYRDSGSLAVDFQTPIAQLVSDFEAKHQVQVEKVMVRIFPTRLSFESDITDTNPNHLKLKVEGYWTSDSDEVVIWTADFSNPATDTRQLAFSYEVGGKDRLACDYSSDELQSNADETNTTPKACFSLALPEVTKAFAKELGLKLFSAIPEKMDVFFVLKNDAGTLKSDLKLKISDLTCEGDSLDIPQTYDYGDTDRDYTYEDLSGKIQCSGLGVIE